MLSKSSLSTVVLGVLAGVVIGLGMYTFVYAKGYSYLTTDPQACTNCHVMQEHFDAWQKSSHRAVATCSDCHTPHNPITKYVVKAENGFFHSLAFTSGWFPDNISIRPRDARVTEGTCRHCHAEITTSIVGPHSAKDMSCVRCHFNVGHSAASFVMSNRPEGQSNGQR
ncbi:MAG TPA: cytochrome c nitrite reductase small subunit [Terriglobales bacterium]|nr:cytochrome c nitrite reductase small subunit [Terriglobales bacterium]